MGPLAVGAQAPLGPAATMWLPVLTLPHHHGVGDRVVPFLQTVELVRLFSTYNFSLLHCSAFGFRSRLTSRTRRGTGDSAFREACGHRQFEFQTARVSSPSELAVFFCRFGAVDKHSAHTGSETAGTIFLLDLVVKRI